MSRKIKNVFVDGISLVSKNEAPAVEQAENKFALFKTINKKENSDLTKTLINLNKNTLEEIKRNL